MREIFYKWGNESERYFSDSDRVVIEQWEKIFKPFVGNIGGDVLVDLATGRGRWVDLFKNNFNTVVGVDVNNENIIYCNDKFLSNSNIRFLLNDGFNIPLDTNSVDYVYCADAMVHFDIDVVVSYLKETKRILKDGGHAFFHHSNLSNLSKSIDINIELNPHWRNFMSKEMFENISLKHGLEVVKQQVIDWGGVKNLDCLTLLKK